MASLLRFPLMCSCKFIHTIPGLEKAEIMRPAYAIEYDYVKSGQLDSYFGDKTDRRTLSLQDRSMERQVMKKPQGKDSSQASMRLAKCWEELPLS